jgi:hypothetical protein
MMNTGENLLPEQGDFPVRAAGFPVCGFTASHPCMRRLLDKRSWQRIYSVSTLPMIAAAGPKDAGGTRHCAANVGWRALRRRIS